MYNVQTVQSGLVGLVGIRQPIDPAYSILDVTNTESRSGRYLNDIPQFKPEFLIDNLDYKDSSDAEKNAQILNIQKSAISTVCSSIFGNNSYIDRNFVFDQASTRTQIETNLVNGFVGFRLRLSIHKNRAFKITRTRLEFEGTGTVKLLLFNSNKNAPLFTKDVVITSNDQLEVLNWVIDSTAGDYKGEYYFGYIYDGSLVPYKRNYEAASVMNYISQLNIEEVYVKDAVDSEIFDLFNVFDLSQNTGLNPDITVYEDYTDLILQNEHLLAHAVQLQYAITCMNNYLNSIRSNRNERYSKEVVALTVQQIEGSVSTSPIKVTGLSRILSNEIDNVKKVFKEINESYFGGNIQMITVY